MVRIFAVLASSLFLTGCSSSLLPSVDFFKSSPSTESLRVESDPPGAEAKTASGQSCKTPCELTVQPGTDQSITLALNGYQPHSVPLQSGEGGKLGPNPVFVELNKVPPVAAKKKKTAAKKPAKPTTTAAVASPTTTAAVTAPPPPAAAPEPVLAPASSSYPWSNPR